MRGRRGRWNVAEWQLKGSGGPASLQTVEPALTYGHSLGTGGAFFANWVEQHWMLYLRENT